MRNKTRDIEERKEGPRGPKSRMQLKKEKERLLMKKTIGKLQMKKTLTPFIKNGIPKK